MSSAPCTPGRLRDLEGLVDHDLGPTAWRQITQEDVDAFAGTTGDLQWIHVDPVRAAGTPFGSTIAHGLFTLALGPGFIYELLSFDAFPHVLNYGYDKVRFPAAVPVGSRVRMTARVIAVEAGPKGSLLR